MFKYHPEIAIRWAHKYGTLKKPPAYKTGKKRRVYKYG